MFSYSATIIMYTRPRTTKLHASSPAGLGSRVPSRNGAAEICICYVYVHCTVTIIIITFIYNEGRQRQTTITVRIRCNQGTQSSYNSLMKSVTVYVVR